MVLLKDFKLVRSIDNTNEMVETNRRSLLGGFIALLILYGCFGVVMYFVIELSKDMRVGDGKAIRDKKSGDIVVTADPLSYAVLEDLPYMPLAVLDALKEFTFSTCSLGIASIRSPVIQSLCVCAQSVSTLQQQTTGRCTVIPRQDTR